SITNIRGGNGTGGINIGAVGNSASASTIHIADTTTNTGAQAIFVGSTANNASNVTTIQGGLLGINGYNILLQTADAAGLAGTIQIGNINTNAAAAQTINIGNTAAANSVTSNVVVGSTFGASLTTLQGGTAGVLVKPANGTTALQVQNANREVALAVDTT